MWARQLQKLLDSTPIAAMALEALRPLAGFADFSIEWDGLKFVVEAQAQDWRDEGKLGRLGLAADFMRCALAIYVYTLEAPAIYRVVNRVMFDPARRLKDAAPSKDLSHAASMRAVHQAPGRGAQAAARRLRLPLVRAARRQVGLPGSRSSRSRGARYAGHEADNGTSSRARARRPQ